MQLPVPAVNIAGRWDRGGISAFVSDAAVAHFLAAYREGMAQLPPFELFDVVTSFGVVRAHRFVGAGSGTPVVLLPGRNASAPMYRSNLDSLLARRTAYVLDLLGEPGLSVQHKPIRDAADQAQWLDETLAGLGLARAHLLGVSIGGWTAINTAVHHPARIASLALLDPVFTFVRIPVRTLLVSTLLAVPAVPGGLRRRVLSWISGGADVDADAGPEAALIAAGSTDFVVRLPIPRMPTDEQLRDLEVPVLALIAGRSVMLDPHAAVARARRLLRHGEIELWSEASHAINGEYPDEIAERAGRFWDAADASRRA